MKDIIIRRVTLADKSEWLRIRLTLWPNTSPDKHLAEMEEILSDPMQPVFVALRPSGKTGGFLEAGTRKYAEDWARAQGLTEMASDTWLDNEVSIRAHSKLGYEETVRLVHFVKKF